ncbi:4'-phosphopantetheinyl transferase family protein [Streptomyces sp. NPDC088785]|uniref:4'-phosphopantetheinyl transferase family protein n=1 Tax=Streptomyces sp. NPDC088785 TaxID=3365897 RepID=UPI0037FD5094
MSARAPEPSAPRPSGGPTLVVVARTAEVLGAPGADERALAGWERHRLARVRVPARRDDVLAARLLLRWCAARVTGRPAHQVELDQHCPDCDRAGHGRPFLPRRPGLGISLSHADGLVAAAAGPGRVGVDVEPYGRVPPGRALVRRRFPAADGAAPRGHRSPEPDALTLWVEAEARFKAGDPAPPAHSWHDPLRAARAAVACADGWRLAEAAGLAPGAAAFG